MKLKKKLNDSIKNMYYLFLSDEKKQVIKSQEKFEAEKTEAIKIFYENIKLIKDETRCYDFVKTYIDAGFLVKFEHNLIINEDPFLFILKNTPVSQYVEYSYNLSLPIESPKVLNLIWNQAISSDYKQEILKEKLAFKEVFLSDASVYDLETRFKKVFKHMQIFKMYVEEMLEFDEHEINKYIKNLQKLLENFSRYTSLYPIEINLLNQIVNQSYLNKNTQRLALLFANESKNNPHNPPQLLETNGPSLENKQINNMIKVLMLYEEKFSEKELAEKQMFKQLLSSIKEINNSVYFNKMNDDYSYIENLLIKHLPQLVSDYMELPEKFKEEFKDKNNKNSRQIFSETLNAMNAYVQEITERVFNNNFTTLKVKHRMTVIK